MFGGNEAFHQHKNAAPVHVEMVGGENVDGLVFLAVGDRLSDLLNDARPFIPIRRADGETVIVAKQHIVSIVERAANAQELEMTAAGSAQHVPDADPYTLLQVAPDAPMADIITACRQLTEKLLPQSMDGVNVKDPQVKSVLTEAKKILNAYKIILRARGLDNSGGAKKLPTASANEKLGNAAK